MNRKASVEQSFQLLKLVFSTTVGCSGIIVSILMGINCSTYYNMIILPSLMVLMIPLIVHFQKKQNTSKLFYFMMWIIHFFCFIFQCNWDRSYNYYYASKSSNFNCPTNKPEEDQVLKIGFGNYYLLCLSITFFHLLELILLSRKIYELATSKKSI